jgi:hypothetical protein
MTHVRTMRGRVGAVLLALLFLPLTTEAQWTPFPPPVDSPYWWTLTDDISPAELRQALQDRDANRQRFRRAMERSRGKNREMVTEQQVHEVSSYIDGDLYPELIPMYVAFDSYAGRFESGPDFREENVTLLTKHGMTATAITHLRRVVSDYSARRNALTSEIGPLGFELMEALRELPRSDRERIHRALFGGDLRALARLTGREVEWIATRHAAWRRDAVADTSIPVLRRLRADLSHDDWQAFRRFLLIEIASQMSGVDTKED